MIGRSVIVKVVTFAVITVLGVGYVLVHYVGVGQTLFGRGFTAYVDLADSGGIFTTASVTYRGIEVGRVGRIELHGKGIRVALNLDGTRSIPTDVRAVIGNGSAIGEQFIDLQPQRNGAPYLHAGSVIPESQTALPVSTQTLLVNVDRLVRSVPRDDLATLVSELGATFSDTGPALQRLLDSTQALVATASTNLPQTTRLIDDSQQVLDTQNAMSNNIVDFAQHLASFSQQMRASDGDIRNLLTQGPAAATQLIDLDKSVDATLPILLGNLVSVGQVSAVRVPALRQILIIYPYVVSTSFGLFPGNGSTRFGVPIPPGTDSQPCATGYIPPAQRRLPSELSYPPIRWNSFCKAPMSSNVGARGARMAPEPNGKRLGDDPSYMDNAGLPTSNGTSGGNATAASAAPTTQDNRTYVLASTGGQQRVLGDRSWTWLILGPLS